MNFAFSILAILLVATALGVVTSRNLVHSALCLILNLFLVAGTFALLDAHFLAAAQVIVYAGAIMVLVLFVIMLLGLRPSPLRPSLVTIVSSVVVGLLFLNEVAPLLLRVFQGVDVVGLGGEGTVRAVGQLLYTKYVFTFEAASLVIMTGIVGAVVLAKRKAGSALSSEASNGTS